MWNNKKGGYLIVTTFLLYAVQNVAALQINVQPFGICRPVRGELLHSLLLCYKVVCLVFEGDLSREAYANVTVKNNLIFQSVGDRLQGFGHAFKVFH